MEVNDQIKFDINYWFKKNYPDCTITKKSLNHIVNILKHETIHFKIFRKFVKETNIIMNLTLIYEDPCNFSCNGKCIARYPLNYSLLRYYPKYIFIEFIQYLYDMIYNIFILRKFKYLIRYTIYFLKTLLEFRIKEVVKKNER